jgi:hypothetical protein
VWPKERAVKENGMTTATARWQDWASFALGLWLAMSPWILGYASHDAATANAAFVGLTLALGSHFEVSFDELSVEWFNMAVGLWLVAAPFIVGFGANTEASANCVVVGALVTALAASALSLDKGLEKWLHEKGVRAIYRE